MADLLAQLRNYKPRRNTYENAVRPYEEMKSYTPSLSQKITDFFNSNVFGDSREGQRKAERLTGVLNMTPVGAATSMYDAGRSVAEGKPGQAAFEAATAGVPEASGLLGHLAPAMIGGMSAKMPLADLDKAKDLITKQLEQFGFVDPRQLYKETNAIVNRSMEPSFVIPMDGNGVRTPARINTVGKVGDSKTLGDVLDSRSLYDQYPELEKLLVHIVPEANYAGFYRPTDRSITMATGGRLTTPEDANTLMHEITHAIDDFENVRHKGSSPDFEAQVIKAKLIANRKEKEAQTLMTGLLRNVGGDPSKLDVAIKELGDKAYRRNPGERRANQVGAFYTYPARTRANIHSDTRLSDYSNEMVKPYQEDIGSFNNLIRILKGYNDFK